MAESLCAPYPECPSLDGRLLINCAVQGPPLAVEVGEIAFGSFGARGAAARPYVDVSVEQSWTAREACHAPARSILGLAPGETVQIVLSQEIRSSLANTVADHLPDVRPPSVGKGAGLASPISAALVEEMFKKKAEASEVARANQYIGAYGSLLGDIVDPLGLFGGSDSPLPTPPTPGDVAGAIVGLIDHTTKGDQAVVPAAIGAAAAAATAAGRSDSRHTRDESTTTTSGTDAQRTLTRTFTNPYRDRSLQLRFIPVFRRFEVNTRPTAAAAGVALHVGEVVFAEARSPVRLSDAAGGANDPALQRRLATMLTNGTGRAAAHRALDWPQAVLRDDAMLVPFAPPGAAAGALGLRGDARSSFVTSVGKAIAGAVASAKVDTRSVYLFMGTHIEAVGGECVLQDLPAPAPPDP